MMLYVAFLLVLGVIAAVVYRLAYPPARQPRVHSRIRAESTAERVSLDATRNERIRPPTAQGRRSTGLPRQSASEGTRSPTLPRTQEDGATARLKATPPNTSPAAKLSAELPLISVTVESASPPRQHSVPSSTAIRKSVPPPAPAHSGLSWVGRGQSVRIADIVLREPLIYVGDGSADTKGLEPAAVDLSLTVARQRYEPTQRELMYWPRYQPLTPGQRRIYLEWIAGGRNTMPPELGYTFLYMYGLERRALVEQTDQKVVFDEIVRLRDLYSAGSESVSRSFESYTSAFLWHLVVRFPQVIQLKRVQPLMLSTHYWNDENLACALSWFAANATPLPDWAAFLVARELPGSQRSVVINRVSKELEKLFRKRYAERFGAGMQLRVSKRERRFAYRPASAALLSMEIAAVNPLGVPSQFEPLSELWNECVQELKKLSSVVAKEGHEAVSVASWEAMPPELRAGIDHPFTEALCALINTRIDDHGRAAVKAAELARVLGCEEGQRLTPGQGRRMCETAAQIGYCLEPDARLTGKGYEGEQLVAVFLRTAEQDADPVRYGAAASMLKFGLAVAGADGHVNEDETTLLLQQVEQTFELNDEERRRLEAQRSLILAANLEDLQLGRLAKNLSAAQRQAVGKLLLAVVAADGVVTPDELRAVRMCYGKLGFEKPEIEAALRSIMPAEDDDVVTVERAEVGADGETIPPATSRAKQVGGLKLNRAAIAAIMQDTREVAEMLASAMAAGDVSSDEVVDVPPQKPVVTPPPAVETSIAVAIAAPPVMTTADPTLPARYAAFYQLLIAKEQWPLEEAESVARKHGHMLSGAIEALNDWAFEKYGGQLFVEDGGQLLVEKQYLS